ncbi:NUDIX hydrolase [Methylophaga sp.]|uniref:NUDIX hydrolase n=1 Tax=Methylophaga sp. TaxID=2024840 RepID=UPI003A8FD48F
MVEEMIGSELKINQPAGHLEDDESLIEAVIRETLEETAWQFTPESLIGIYRWRHPQTENTYIRFCFAGSLGDKLDRPLDTDIHQAVWLDATTIQKRRSQFRSPLVEQCLQDYLAGKRYSLDLLTD